MAYHEPSKSVINMATAAQIMHAQHHDELMAITSLSSAEHYKIINKLEFSKETLNAARFAINKHPDTLMQYGFDGLKLVEMMKQIAIYDRPLIVFDYDLAHEVTDVELTQDQAREIFMAGYSDIIMMANSIMKERSNEYVDSHPGEFPDDNADLEGPR